MRGALRLAETTIRKLDAKQRVDAAGGHWKAAAILKDAELAAREMKEAPKVAD